MFKKTTNFEFFTSNILSRSFVTVRSSVSDARNYAKCRIVLSMLHGDPAVELKLTNKSLAKEEEGDRVCYQPNLLDDKLVKLRYLLLSQRNMQLWSCPSSCPG